MLSLDINQPVKMNDGQYTCRVRLIHNPWTDMWKQIHVEIIHIVRWRESRYMYHS